jgi:predicted O-methyltransferase YrrM
VRALAPSEIRNESASAFNDLVASLAPAPARRILDVGAGGFLGTTTTEFLIAQFPDAEVWAVEIDEDRAQGLREKFGDSLEVVTTDVAAFETEEPFDLVVLDLDSGRIPMTFERLLPDVVPRLLRPGGLLVTLTFTNIISAYGGPRAFPPGNAQAAADFMSRYFGRPVLSDAHVKTVFAADRQYEPLALVEKFRGDPHSFVGWLALRRRSDAPAVPTIQEAEAAAAAAPTPRVRELVAAGEVDRFDFRGDESECGPDCEAFVRTWSDWARTAFGGTSDVPGEAEWEMAREAVALLDVQASDDDYLKQIGDKSRNMLRKADRNGYVSRVFEHNDHLEDLHAIHTSKEVRSGRPLTDAYREFPQAIRADQGLCRRHGRIFVGAFRDDHLWGYAQLVLCDELAVINRFMGHGERLRDGIMNAVVAHLRQICHERGGVVAINYLTLRSSTEGLDRFKRSVGFRERAALLRLAGR